MQTAFGFFAKAVGNPAQELRLSGPRKGLNEEWGVERLVRASRAPNERRTQASLVAYQYGSGGVRGVSGRRHDGRVYGLAPAEEGR